LSNPDAKELTIGITNCFRDVPKVNRFRNFANATNENERLGFIQRQSMDEALQFGVVTG
jgi:hypothetical protein